VIQFFLTLGDALQYIGYYLSPVLALPLVILVKPKLGQLCLRVSNVIDTINLGLLRIAGWAVLIMAIGMLTAVILRYVFGESFGWLKDIWIYAFACCFLLAAAGALKNDAHVRVDIFYANLSDRTKSCINLAGFYLFLLPLMILILDAYAPLLARSWGAFSGRLEMPSETDGLPLVFLFKTLPPVFAITMIFQGWSQAVKAAAVLKSIPVPSSSQTQSSSI
jgi:TRAP-type mannitol/chloroaromatic compound transport system permease small subunit